MSENDFIIVDTEEQGESSPAEEKEEMAVSDTQGEKQEEKEKNRSKAGEKEGKSSKEKKDGFLENKEIVKKCVLGAAGVVLVVLLAVLGKLVLDSKRKKKKR